MTEQEMTEQQSAPHGPPGTAHTGADGAGQQGPGQPGPYGDDLPLEDRAAAETFASFAERAWLAVMATAVGVFAVGLILLAWPHATLTVVAILLGVSLIVAGLMKLGEGFTAREATGGRRAAYVLIGLIAVVAGLYCLRHHDVTIFLLAFVVGVFWIIHGAADLGVAITAGPFPGRGLRAAGGVLSLAAGLVVLFWPGISLVLLLIIFGAWLMFYGVVLGAMAMRMRHTGQALRKGAAAGQRRPPASAGGVTGSPPPSTSAAERQPG